MKRKKQFVQCSSCGQISLECIGENEFKSVVRITKSLRSSKTTHEKKVALSNWLKSLDLGSLQSEENQRVYSLLLSGFCNELAKQSMKEYKKITASIFSREK
jgi:hypothetical protein